MRWDASGLKSSYCEKISRQGPESWEIFVEYFSDNRLRWL